MYKSLQSMSLELILSMMTVAAMRTASRGKQIDMSNKTQTR